MSEKNIPEKPEWLEGNSVNEVAFSKEFLENHPMKSVGGSFFTPDGMVEDEENLRKLIFDMLKPYITVGLTKKVSGLLEVIRMECHCEGFPVQLDRIHAANETFHLDGSRVRGSKKSEPSFAVSEEV